MPDLVGTCQRCSEVHAIGHISLGPNKVLRSEPAGDLWCFGCRKRLPHTWKLLGDELPTYYDPEWVCRCSSCGKCLTRFPGT